MTDADAVGTENMQMTRLERDLFLAQYGACVETFVDEVHGDTCGLDIGCQRILDCVRAYATLGEICDELRGVYGVYEEPAF